MKVLISLAVIAFASKVNSQIPSPLPVITFDMSGFNQPQMVHQMHGRENEMMHEMEQQHQIELMNQQRQSEMQHMMEMQHREMMHQMEQQRQHEQMMEQQRQHEMMMNQQGRDAGQMAEEPIVGSISPLDLKLAKPFGLGGIGLPLPGFRFSNLNLGHLGGIGFGHSILGAANPMAEDNLEAAPHAEIVEKSHHHHHHHVEPLVGAAPDQQGFIGWPWIHWANPNDEVGAVGPDQPMPPMMPMQPMMQPQEFELAAPPMQHFDMQPVGPPMMQPMGNPMMQPFEMAPQQVEDGARHFWKKGGYGYE